MRLDHDGQLGIGTATPTALLDVAGTVNITGDTIVTAHVYVRQYSAFQTTTHSSLVLGNI
jgi:hypothetical protein